MFLDASFVLERLLFRTGDTLVVYSDGFTEAGDPAGDAQSLEGFETLGCRYVGPPEELAHRLIADAHALGAVTDDLTLVVGRHLPHAAPQCRSHR
jgi:serine phosphatase RsbU (regulator of sigma subunit)